jgi:hypothetical protein
MAKRTELGGLKRSPAPNSKVQSTQSKVATRAKGGGRKVKGHTSGEQL